MSKITKAQALEALDNLDDCARMTVGVDAVGPRETLRRFIEQFADVPRTSPIKMAPCPHGARNRYMCSVCNPKDGAMSYE